MQETNEQIIAKDLLLKSTLYKTIAWAFILFLPASKLYDCSPNYDFIMTMGAICDMNSLVVLFGSCLLFFIAKTSHKKALTILNSQSSSKASVSGN
jgi:hypothetical protein